MHFSLSWNLCINLVVFLNVIHSDIVSCVAWHTTDEVLSCSDDHEVLVWNLISNETTKLLTLPNDLFPTDMHIFPRTSNTVGIKKQIGGDMFIITTTDGKSNYISIYILYSSIL